MDSDELAERIAGIRWFHTIALGRGMVTPGIDPTPEKLAGIGLPADLSGRTVLDIGAWDGFFSFEAERRGAERVLATDSFCWSGDGWGTRDGFNLAREVLQSKVEDRVVDVMDLTPDAVGTFDLVIFLGVLYHLRHPLLALEKVAGVTSGCLILETEVDLVGLRRPAMAFYPGTELNHDPTNWWAPNPSALEGMLKDVGFSRVETVTAPRSLPRRAARATKQWLTQGKNPVAEFRRDRIVVHAWK